MLELDHVIVFCNPGAPETAALRGVGLIDDSGQTHAGQGTANRRISFANAFLELAWVHDTVEARSALVLPTQLWERWEQREMGCPFGLVLRPGDNTDAPPFPTWSYRPPYLPSELSIEVALGVTAVEPLVFYLPFARRRGSAIKNAEQPAGIARITDVLLYAPGGERLSPAMDALTQMKLVTTAMAGSHHAEIGFVGSRTTALDARPTIPVVFRPRH